MASPPSQALAKRSADTALMRPPAAPKRIKRPAIVLDEDTYTDGLSHIIARDFFPGLLESETQQEYLDAVESRDKGWIREAGAKLTQIMTPGPDGRRARGRRGVSMTPMRESVGETPKSWGGDTPAAASQADGTDPDEKQQVDLNMNLSSFQAKYTSEDNESFNALLDKQNAKRAEKYDWLYNGNKILSGHQIAHRERQQKLLEASASQKAKEAKYGEIGTGQELVKRPVHPDDRPAMPDIKQPQSRNPFMFTPDGVEDILETRAQASEARSNAPPKQIKYDSTRLPPPASTADLPVPPSPSMSAVDAAIAGRPRPTESEPGYDGSETPRVNGYAFVDEEPTARELGEDPSPEPEENLLALLGESGDGSHNPFTIAGSSKRESLHHAMVEKTSRGRRAGNRLDALREGKADVGRTPTPKFLSATPRPGAGNLTPAAQKLLGKVGTPVRGEVVSNVFGNGGQGKRDDKWTPKVALTPRRPA